jgi:short-subunit dehydrogenase
VAITGASSGIGAAFARRLAPEHDLLLIARRADRLAEMAAEFLKKYQSQVDIVKADLSIESELAAAADRIAAENRLELLINNAGFGVGGPFWEASLAAQERMHRLHIIASLRLTHAALGNLVARDTGAVINVASVSAWVRRPGFIGYAATKSWMTAFTEGLYLELREANSKVTVQALCPGFVYTEFHDRMGVDRERLAGPGFWLRPEEVVEVSLDGLRQRKLFVFPGFRYRALTVVLSILPTTARLAVQRIVMRGRGEL